MEAVLPWAFVVASLIIIGYVARQAYTGKRPLLSVRNMFLIGLIVFQYTSAASAFLTGEFGDLVCSEPTVTGVKYLLLLTMFLIFFLLVYDRAWFTFGLQNRVKVSLPIPGTGPLVTLSIASLIVAAFCRVVLADLGVFGIMAEIASGAFAAMAAGTASWAWAGRPKNLALIAFVLVMVAGASAVATYEAFTRREIVSVMVGCLWGAYHGGFKNVNMRRAAIPMVGIGLAGFFLVAAFTSTRGNGLEIPSISERLQHLPDADIEDGALQMLAGQDAAPNSMWAIENHPEPVPYDTLASLVYFVVHPIPRVIWDDKPVGLGSLMVRQAGVSGKGEGYSLGPGLMGHIFNDNPWIALPLYAILLGAGLRFLDDLLKRFPNQPYVVLPLGIELGEIVGLSRGELGFFLFRAVAGMTCAYFGTIFVAKLLRALGFSSYSPEYSDPQASDGEADVPYDTHE